MENIDILYDKVNSNYTYLESIMGAYYDGTLNYEGLLPTLNELKEKTIQTRDDCTNELVFDRVNQVIKYIDDIMEAIYENKLNTNEVIPALGELGMNMLGAQKYIAGTDELLLTKIEDKENVLADALASTKSNVR